MNTFTVTTHTSSEAGFLANAHLIAGKDEALLVDTAFLRSDARRVAEMVRASGRHLAAIFVTHGHPDHFFGLELLKKEFPGADLIATRAVTDAIRAQGQSYIDFWKNAYGDDLPSSVTVPKALDENRFDLEGREVRVIPLGAGESGAAAALFIPSAKLLVAGDAAYDKVHLWLKEHQPAGWLRNIEQLRALPGVERVLPGHGVPATPDVLRENETYINDFLAIVEAAGDRDDAYHRLTSLFPDYQLPIIARMSVEAFMTAKAGV